MYPLSRARQWTCTRTLSCPSTGGFPGADPPGEPPYCPEFWTGIGGLCFRQEVACAAAGEAPAVVVDAPCTRKT